MDNINTLVALAWALMALNLAIICALLCRRPRQPYDHFAHRIGRLGTVRNGEVTLCKAKVLRVNQHEVFTTYGRFVNTCRIQNGDDGRQLRLWQAAHDSRITFTFDA